MAAVPESDVWLHCYLLNRRFCTDGVLRIAKLCQMQSCESMKGRRETCRTGAIGERRELLGSRDEW